MTGELKKGERSSDAGASQNCVPTPERGNEGHSAVLYDASLGIFATMRSEVVNSSNCSHGRSQATAL